MRRGARAGAHDADSSRGAEDRIGDVPFLFANVCAFTRCSLENGLQNLPATDRVVVRDA